jgi:hypothetical protein
MAAGRAAITPKRGLTRRISSSAGGMITKTFFLVKIIHRIGTRSFRQEKSLLENLAEYRASFTLWATRRTVSHNPLDLHFQSLSSAQGALGASTAVDRLTGTESALKPYISDGSVKVVLNQSANSDTGTAQSMMSSLLAAHPDSQAVISGNDAQPEDLADIKAGTQYSTVIHSTTP